MVAGIEDIHYWRELREAAALRLYPQSVYALPEPDGFKRVHSAPSQLTCHELIFQSPVGCGRCGNTNAPFIYCGPHSPILCLSCYHPGAGVMMAASGGDCQKCGQATYHRYFYGSITLCGECYRNAIGAEPPVSQSQRAVDNQTAQEATEIYPRPIPKSNVEDADEISKRIREIAAEENRQPTIDRISPPKDPQQESPES